jgi:hypothetical protein
MEFLPLHASGAGDLIHYCPSLTVEMGDILGRRSLGFSRWQFIIQNMEAQSAARFRIAAQPEVVPQSGNANLQIGGSHRAILENGVPGIAAKQSLRKCAFRFPNYPISAGRDATFCLEAILASQPFREWPGTDSYLRAPEHRTQEPDLGRKVSLRMSPRLALYDYLARGDPEQSPLRRKVLHLDQIGRTQIIAALAHSGARIPPDSFRCVP